MKRFLFLVVSLFNYADASEWLCREEASQRRGNVILACGIGESQSEDRARLQALESAKAEFRSLCEDDEECRDHATVVTPERTECELTDIDTYRCYRLISFTLGEYVANRGPSQLYKALGPPESVVRHTSLDGSTSWTQLVYRGSMCRYPDHSCYVILDNQQKIIERRDLVIN